MKGLVSIIDIRPHLPTISALRYMMRISGNDDSCYACHECIMSRPTPIVINLVSCPWNSNGNPFSAGPAAQSLSRIDTKQLRLTA